MCCWVRCGIKREKTLLKVTDPHTPKEKEIKEEAQKKGQKKRKGLIETVEEKTVVSEIKVNPLKEREAREAKGLQEILGCTEGCQVPALEEEEGE